MKLHFICLAIVMIVSLPAIVSYILGYKIAACLFFVPAVVVITKVSSILADYTMDNWKDE